MSRLAPVSWREFVTKLKHLGFDGPYYGGKHPYMVRNDMVLTIPNPHDGDIGMDLLRRILRQAGISRQDWLQA